MAVCFNMLLIGQFTQQRKWKILEVASRQKLCLKEVYTDCSNRVQHDAISTEHFHNKEKKIHQESQTGMADNVIV